MNNVGKPSDPIVQQATAPMFEIVIRWIPQTGQVQFAASNGLDKVAMLGLLEMAKATVMQPQTQQPPLIVPGRFGN